MFPPQKIIGRVPNKGRIGTGVMARVANVAKLLLNCSLSFARMNQRSCGRKTMAAFLLFSVNSAEDAKSSRAFVKEGVYESANSESERMDREDVPGGMYIVLLVVK